MGKPAHYEGVVLDGYQPAAGPRSSWEVWREPAGTAPPANCEANAEPQHALPTAPLSEWTSIPGLEAQQCDALQKLSTRGVHWKHPTQSISMVFTLHHGGDVAADGNCLFTSFQKAMQLIDSPLEIRQLTVQRFSRDYEANISNFRAIDASIKHLYSPNLSAGWGVHVVQEVKLLAKKSDRDVMDAAINELVQVGVARDAAAESVYKEHCLSIEDGEQWAKYMSIAGQSTDEYDIVTLLYTEEGLLSIDENREGRAAAFGDDIAIESLATEYEREIFVVQAHGADGMIEGDNCLFFLPHCPRTMINHLPIFLFMKGTGWCGAGADHYEPIIARTAPTLSRDKAAISL
ncbi:hypothetical protein O6H91_10G004900 [Diphasiastrum complanatum]|uniref:Uncharacterized protein n=1 Tax=Diphasiastrum complanatum TaxID=34168 RepID=A0ACC2CDX9_DIPCM|nr:hypothetical protein O6H91_10G004900 [Diphasiastrum complanatum]